MTQTNLIRVAVLSLSTAFAAGIWGADPGATAYDQMLGHYEMIRLQLLNDSSIGVSKHASDISDVAAELTERFDPVRAAVRPSSRADCVRLLDDIKLVAGRLSKAPDLMAMRKEFGALSAVMVRYHEMTGRSDSVVVFCPMLHEVWLQPSGEIGNPYYGQSMARCGEIVEK